jgi:lipase ATG15
MKFGQSTNLLWEEEEIAAPDIESRDTLLTLAKMANNAYVEPGDPAWYELDSNWTVVRSFMTFDFLSLTQDHL